MVKIITTLWPYAMITVILIAIGFTVKASMKTMIEVGDFAISFNEIVNVKFDKENLVFHFKKNTGLPWERTLEDFLGRSETQKLYKMIYQKMMTKRNLRKYLID